MTPRLLVASMLLATGSTAYAGFAIDGIPAQGSETSSLGAHAPYERRGNASFAQSPAALAPRQERYRDAELLVDLAYSSVTERGSGPSGTVDGFGDNLPFASALSMIVPSGWHIYRSPDLSKKAIPESVSFAGGKPWPRVIKDIGDKHALQFHIDWYDRAILIKPGRVTAATQASQISVIAEPARSAVPAAANPAIPAGAKSIQLPAASTGAVTVNAQGYADSTAALPGKAAEVVKAPVAMTPPALAKTAPPVIARQLWVAPKGSSLRKSVMTWGKKAGWEVDWQAYDLDYPIEAELRFEGSFEEAIAKVFPLYERAPRPFTVSGSRPQKRLIVSEKGKGSN